MYDKGFTTSCSDVLYKINQLRVRVLVIDADAMFNSYVNIASILHRFYAVSHELWMTHQTSANHIILYAIARAADVEVYFIITPLLSKFCALGQLIGFTATQLKSDRVLFFTVSQKTISVAMNQRTCCDHLCIQHGVFCKHSPKLTAMSIAPFHHGGCAEFTVKRVGHR